MSESLDRRVRERAKDRCEYCRIPASISEFTFPLDHIIAQQHRGETTPENLALSWPHCNYNKGPHIAGLDAVSGKLTRLFNPRRDRWSTHFAWHGPVILAKTAVGRATPYVLAMNHPDRVELRRLLIEAGLLPPK
jgi:hypothetical protein